MSEGDVHHDTALWRGGLERGRRAIEAWPEFNWFTLGYTLSARPDTSALFREALEMQWKTDGRMQPDGDRSHRPEAGDMAHCGIDRYRRSPASGVLELADCPAQR